MSILSAHKPEIKSACLSSVSLHVIQLGYGVLPEFECAEYEDIASYGDQTDGTWALLIWIRLWLNWLCGVEQDEPCVERTPYTPNRRARRTQRCSISFVRYYHHYLKFCPKGMTTTQFLECVCRLSPHGRIRIYRMRQSGSVLRRRAMLVCYDHGWWRAPIGIFGRVRCGFWQVHLLPDWLLHLGVPMNQINPPGINFMGGPYTPVR